MTIEGAEVRSQESEVRIFYSVSCILYFVFLLFSTPAFAQEPLSLNALIEEAKANNPEIQAFRERVKADYIYRGFSRVVPESVP